MPEYRGLSHTCEFALHHECLGLERYWDERYCSCGEHVMAKRRCPHTTSQPCGCPCHA